MFGYISERVRELSRSCILTAETKADGRRRTKQESSETRARILNAARKLFEEEGAAGLSMRSIGVRAEIPTATVYGYFPSKTAIIRGLWSLAFDPLFAELSAEGQRHTDPKLRLKHVALTYMHYWIGHADRYRMVFLVEDSPEPADESWFINQTSVIESYLRFSSMIADARGETNRDCQVEAEALICALNGVVHMAVTVSEYPWSLPEQYLDIILVGCVGSNHRHRRG